MMTSVIPRVLIADDDSGCVDALITLLDNGNMHLARASTGREALLKTAIWDPDIILLDIGLPDISGYEVCARIKSDEKTRDTTVIFLTGLADTTDEEKGLRLGAVDYITKPVSLPILKARLDIHIELRQKTKLLETMALLDGLTQIPNRRYFNDVLTREWNRCSRFGDTLSLLMIDIDYFKQYNDHYGHLAGDVCLQQVAGLLKQNLKRSTDIVARYGGEEFAILLPQFDSSDLLSMADTLRGSVEDAGIRHEAKPGTDIVTVSIGGGSLRPQAGQDSADLINIADKALYQAKNEGRNKVVIECRSDP
ncbi:MAG: diguanylate cyclase [Ketobacteraceae bacterium]|nr:diguanylate cyclase [Ketobacteraceae bacterium]